MKDVNEKEHEHIVSGEPISGNANDIDYANIDYGKPRKCAFATLGVGDKFETMKNSLAERLNYFVPGIDLIDIDLSEAKECFPQILKLEGTKYVYCCARLAIPIMRQFEGYDRVIAIDADIDILSGKFSGVLSEETSDDGLAASKDRENKQKWYIEHEKKIFGVYDKDYYVNGGLVIFDLFKIDKKKWKERVDYGLEKVIGPKKSWYEQDLINAMFSVRAISREYNYLYPGFYENGVSPYAIHYVRFKNSVLLKIIGERDGLPYESRFGHITGINTSTARDSVVDNEDQIDAVFVIGKGSKHENEELRYSLRNLEANCKFIRNVYICGECPDWVNKSEVIHLQWPDRFHHCKDANIIDKIRHACETPGISKTFMKCSDDQFQTRECSLSDFYPRYTRVYSADDDFYEKNSSSTKWYTFMRETLERERIRREENGGDVSSIYMFEPHIWMPMDRDTFISYAKWSDYEHRRDVNIGSGYYNFAGVVPQKRSDHTFVRKNTKSLNTLHVAYSDGAYYRAMYFLRKLFPRRSRFELDDGNMHENARAIFYRRISE